MTTKPIHRLVAFLLLSALFPGCATHIAPSTETNPRPSETFSNFNRFELAPLQAGSTEVANQRAALNKIGQNLQERLGVRVQQWNNQPADAPIRTLLIEPTVTEMKFVSGAKRVWLGATAGSSAVILKARISDKETGNTVATPEFYSKSSAMGGGLQLRGQRQRHAGAYRERVGGLCAQQLQGSRGRFSHAP